ncbi:MAG: energy transducer TonB [Neisseria sp.]|jgi:tonB family C-terminal domain|nr:energy transducer TonB [Neisseria sp.]
MNIIKPSTVILLVLSTFLAACSSSPGKKLPSVEEILIRPEVSKPKVVVAPTPDGEKGGVLSVINEKGGVDGAVCRDEQVSRALCNAALAKKRQKRYQPTQNCSNSIDENGQAQKVCKNVPAYAEYIYLLYGKHDNFAGGVYRKLNVSYPRLSQENGEEGEIVLKVLVSPKGGLDSVKILQSSGYTRLDKAAKAAMISGIFLPAVTNGQPVWSQFNAPVNFKLE